MILSNFQIVISPQPNAGAEKPFSYDPTRNCAVLVDAVNALRVEIFGLGELGLEQGIMAYALQRHFPDRAPTDAELRDLNTNVILAQLQALVAAKQAEQDRQETAGSIMSGGGKPRRLSIGEAAEILGISETAVVASTLPGASPRLKAKHEGGRLVFRLVDLYRFLDAVELLRQQRKANAYAQAITEVRANPDRYKVGPDGLTAEQRQAKARE